MTRSIKTIEANSIKYMLRFVEEYEMVKRKEHPEYLYARDYFKANGICFQNFYKFYKRYTESNRDVKKLLPMRRGPKPKYRESELADIGSVESLVLEYRKKGFNKFYISEIIKQKHNINRFSSPSTVYRILKSNCFSRLTRPEKEEKKKIIKERRDEILHVDYHYLPKGVVKSEPQSRYYTLGVIDDYSRIAWVEVMRSTKSLDATFAMMDAMLILNQRYGIEAEEVLTDNGSEFCSADKMNHPFERLLDHFAIKHRRTKPYRPQTNGKIERFWRTFDEDVIEGSEFETLDELKDAVFGYNFYYNEARPHQGIGGKKPIQMTDNKTNQQHFLKEKKERLITTLLTGDVKQFLSPIL